MNWKNFTIVLLCLGCLHFVSLAFRGRVQESDQVELSPMPVMSAAPGESELSYRKFGDGGKRLLNSREGW